jgi:hypothetical protein
MIQMSKSVNEGLKDYFKEDNISEYYNDITKMKENVVKKSIISKSPNILILQFKRITDIKTLKFWNQKEKKYDEKIIRIYNEDHIKFDLNLDISEFCDKVIGKYKLKSIIIHFGKGNTGHHYSIVKKGNIWYCKDDISETTITVNDLLKKNVYMLFYTKEFPYNQKFIQEVNSDDDDDEIIPIEKINNDEILKNAIKVISKLAVISKPTNEIKNILNTKTMEEKKEKRKPCRYFNDGHCKNGDNCKFEHRKFKKRICNEYNTPRGTIIL